MISMKKGFIVIIISCLFLLMLGCTDTTTQSTTTTTTEGDTSTMSTTFESSPLFEKIEVINDEIISGEMLEMVVLEEEGNETLRTLYNPYDYNQIRVEFVYTSPSNETVKQLAFWYKEYEELAVIGEKIDEFGFYTAGQELVKWKTDGLSQYRVRITPNEVGEWTYEMKVNIAGNLVQTMTGNFTVLETSEEVHGLIRVDQTNHSTFVFDSGETFIPNGVNLAWWSTTLASHDYDNWFKKLSMNEANYARIWLSNWSFSLHKDSYSDFDTRQSVAIRLDHVLEVAKENGIYIMLTLINHGQFSSNTNPEWAENKYNIDNGGMLTYPIQFFYNEEAKTAYKNELLYILARYGYSSNIFAWELFNEVDWIDGYSAIAVTRWHDEMATYLHDNDPYNHLVTTSYKYTFGTSAYSLDSIDFCAFHSYAYGDTEFYTKLISETLSLQNQYNKPVFFGEIGINWESGDSTYHADYTGTTIIQANWGGIMLGAGGAAHWWWDSWIEKYDLWNLYLGAGTFAKEIDLAGKEYTQLANLASVDISANDIKVMGYLLEDTIYGYLYNKNYSYWNRTPDEITNINLFIPIASGTYTLEVYDTLSGEILSTEEVVITENGFEWDGLSISTDLAFILKK